MFATCWWLALDQQGLRRHGVQPQSGLRVSVVDDNPAAGGQIWRGEQAKPSSAEAQEWFERIRSVDIQMINGARVFQQPRSRDATR